MRSIPTRDASFCLVGIGLGLLALVLTNVVVGDFMEPRAAACQRTDIAAHDFAAATGFQPYDNRVGFWFFDWFVCIITQFFYDMVTAGPGGILVGFGTFVTGLPAFLLIALEAGRQDARGLIRYPMVFALLVQVLGVSVVFPLLWVPSYVLGRGNEPLSGRRIILSTIPALAYSVFAVPTFFLKPTTPFWTTCAGILGGPAIVLSFLPLWATGSSPPSAKSRELSTMPYAAAGAVGSLVWLWLLALLVVPKIGLNPVAIYKIVWAEASPCTKFMTIDLTILWLATVIVIGYQKPSAAWEALGLSCLFGPGAALALVLAGLQVDDTLPRPSLLQGTRQEPPRSKKDD